MPVPALLCPLDRAVLVIEGEDRVAFLQGLTSNDVTQVGHDTVTYSILLTPQGRFLFDFSIAAIGDQLLLDVERPRAAELLRRLSVFRLRARVRLALAEDWIVAAVPDTGVADRFALPARAGAARHFAGGVAFVDPRLADLGVRLMVPAAGIEAAAAALGLALAGDDRAWQAHRIALGVPEAGIDIPIERSTLLEANLHLLGGVSWSKGCYMGQELTARTHYRGLLKRRLFALAVAGGPVAPGTPVLADGIEIGEVRSSTADRAIAHLKIDAALRAASLGAGSARLIVDEPAWMAGTPSRSAAS